MKRRLKVAACVTAVCVAGGLSSCASTAGSESDLPVRPGRDITSAQGMWVPNARASIANLGEEKTYSLVHDAGRDVMVVEEPILDPRRPERQIGRYTWLVPLSMYGSVGGAREVGSGGQAAWVLENLHTYPGRAASVTGRIIIESRSAEEVTVSVNLRAAAPDPVAGQAQAEALELNRRFTLPRREVYAVREGG